MAWGPGNKGARWRRSWLQVYDFVGVKNAFKKMYFRIIENNLQSLSLGSTTVVSVTRRVDYFSVCACLNGGQNWRIRYSLLL